MTLRGNLSDFSLPDIFHLVASSQKSGVLRIKGDDTEGAAWFRDGEVFFAQSNQEHELLGQRMVTAGKITVSALGRALEIQKVEPADGRRLGQILMDEGDISKQVLEAFVQEQIQDTIFDLMCWDEGDFDFEPISMPVDEDIGLSISIENVIMEGSRRLDEWTRIKKKIPSTDIVFKMATAPGEGTFEISLKPTEWHLLLKIDGTRTVSELAQDTNRSDFEVTRILYGLFSANLLEVVSEDVIALVSPEEEIAIDVAVADEDISAPPIIEPTGDPEIELQETGVDEPPVEGIAEPMGVIPEDAAHVEEDAGSGALSELMSSLEELSAAESEDTADSEMIATEEVIEESPTEGTISTDTFLSDIDVSSTGIGLTAGITDELTALTGGRGARQRSTATANKTSERDEQGVRLKRDTLVDQDTIRKIIRGIENL